MEVLSFFRLREWWIIISGIQWFPTSLIIITSLLPVVISKDAFLVEPWKFGSISCRQRKLVNRLKEIQLSREKFNSRYLERLDCSLQIELETLLLEEEMFWKWKVKDNSLAFRDQNTSYFHSLVAVKKSRNYIKQLQNVEGEFISNHKSNKPLVLSYFSNLYISYATASLLQTNTNSNNFLQDHQEVLCSQPTLEEVKSALMSMNGTKTQRPNGLPALLYQN